MHSVLPILIFVLWPFALLFNSYRIKNASVLENVSRLGKSSKAKDTETDCYSAALLASPIPFLIAYKAASSMSLMFPVIPFAPTA